MVPSPLPLLFAMSLPSICLVACRVALRVVSALTRPVLQARARGAGGRPLAPAAPPPAAAVPPGRAVDPEALPLPRPQGVEQRLQPDLATLVLEAVAGRGQLPEARVGHRLGQGLVGAGGLAAVGVDGPVLRPVLADAGRARPGPRPAAVPGQAQDLLAPALLAQVVLVRLPLV